MRVTPSSLTSFSTASFTTRLRTTTASTDNSVGRSRARTHVSSTRSPVISRLRTDRRVVEYAHRWIWYGHAHASDGERPYQQYQRGNPTVRTGEGRYRSSYGRYCRGRRLQHRWFDCRRERAACSSQWGHPAIPGRCPSPEDTRHAEGDAGFQWLWRERIGSRYPAVFDAARAPATADHGGQR